MKRIIFHILIFIPQLSYGQINKYETVWESLDSRPVPSWFHIFHNGLFFKLSSGKLNKNTLQFLLHRCKIIIFPDSDFIRYIKRFSIGILYKKIGNHTMFSCEAFCS